MGNIDIRNVLEGILVLLFSIGLHEYAHAKAADMAGDDTPRLNGRLSLNPLDHFDPFGAIMILVTLIAGFGIGWGKPVPVNPFNFKNLRIDNLKVSLAGITVNLCIAAFFGMLIRLKIVTPQSDYMLFHLAGSFVIYNLGLAFFNLIPVPPLDGSHVLPSIMPIELAKRYEMFFARWGMLPFIALLMAPHVIGVNIIGELVGGPIYKLCPMLMGAQGFIFYIYGLPT